MIIYARLFVTLTTLISPTISNNLTSIATLIILLFARFWLILHYSK